ncbi:MAG: peptidoglycan-binding protein LysM [Bacillota bacterium]
MVEKAKIIPYDKNGREDKTNEVVVMFNPNEYTVSVEAKYTGEDNKKQFLITEIPELKVSLFYDTYDKRSDVRKETGKIIALMKPTIPGKETKRPPECSFIWGKFSYRGVITSVQQRFTMFLENGIPVRAVLDVTFTSHDLDKKVENLKGLEACRKLWMVKSGDRLDLIANEVFKDPLQWRRIAKANRIVNPVDFPGRSDIGKTLVIPD